MTTPRRRLIRSTVLAVPPTLQRPARLLKLRQRRAKEQATLARLLTRLKRVFHAMEKSQASVARLERTIARLED
jgi:hypothetical protein